MDIGFRRVTAKDRDFLFEVFAQAREDDIAAMGWTPQQKAIYLDHQFKAQHSSYRKKFPRASYQVVTVDGDPAGRLYVDRRTDEIRILDLSLLKNFRNQGVGTELVGQLCGEAREKGHVVGVHIPRGSRAMRLAARLGFECRIEAENSNYMLWDPVASLAR